MSEQPESIQKIKYENINVDAACKAALKTKGDSGPSGIDVNGWKKIQHLYNFLKNLLIYAQLWLT